MGLVPAVILFTGVKSANISTKSLWRGRLHNVKNSPDGRGNIFHNEEDALAATIQLFRGDSIGWDEDYE
jgi:hypothetical protein